MEEDGEYMGGERGKSAVHDDRKKGYFTFNILKIIFQNFR